MSESRTKLMLLVGNVIGLLLLASVVFGQEIVVEGDVAKIKVKRLIEVEEERLLIKSAPFKLKAPDGGFLYRWRFPAGVEAVELGRVLEVKTSPKGELTFSVQWGVLEIDFDKKTSRVEERAKAVAYLVGDVGPGPKPPTPPDPPTPPPDAAPYPSPGLTAMIVYETAELSSHQGLSDVMSGAKTNDFMASKGIKHGFLKLDKDTNPANLQDGWAKAALAVALLHRAEHARKTNQQLPWLVVSNGKTGFSGPVPSANGIYSPAETLKLLQKHGD